MSLSNRLYLVAYQHPRMNNPTRDHVTSVIVNCEREKWRIEAETNIGMNDRELTQLKIMNHNNNMEWIGTIQDLSAIPVILDNAIRAIGEDSCYAETVAKLKHLLSHYQSK